MCELLALSSSQPTRLTFSLNALAARGGLTGTMGDGWGVAFYQGMDVALFREPLAAADSALVRFLETQGPSTPLAISHIRHATRGTVQLANTQPFVRELGGRTHVFAHNGDLSGIDESAVFELGPDRPYRPVGQTDSEHAFCALLTRLRPLWQGDVPPSLEARLVQLTVFAADLRALGPANFLYADGDALFAHGHRRLHQAGTPPEPPGLWMLQQHCPPAKTPPDTLGALSIDQPAQAVVLFASVPLTEEAWRPLTEGELLAVRGGEVLTSCLPGPAPEF